MNLRKTYFHLIVAMAFCICGADAAMTQSMKKEIFGTYGWSEHIDPDGRPSRVDHRYRSESITLNDDSTFVFTVQHGRLSPAYGYKKGVWHVENDTVLVCDIQMAKELNLFAAKGDASEEWTPRRGTMRFTIDRGRLYDRAEDRYFN